MTWYNILMIVGIPSILSFLFQCLFKITSERLSNNKKTDITLKKGIQALLRDRLRDEYERLVGQGHATLDDKDNYEAMYLAYHNLGKNGVMTRCYKEVFELPTVEHN